MFDKLEAIERRLIHIEDSLASPNLDGEQFVKLTKERAEIEDVVIAYRAYKALKKALDETREILDSGDKDMAELAKEEYNGLQEQLKESTQALKLLLLPTDPLDVKN